MRSAEHTPDRLRTDPTGIARRIGQLRGGSEVEGLAEAVVAVLRDDDVIEHADAEQLAG